MLSGWILNPGGAQTVNVNCGDFLLTVLALPVVKNQFITQVQLVILKKYYLKYFFGAPQSRSKPADNVNFPS